MLAFNSETSIHSIVNFLAGSNFPSCFLAALSLSQAQSTVEGQPSSLCYLSSSTISLMTLTTIGVAVNTTPVFFSTFFKHYIVSPKKRKERKGTVQRQWSYSEGLTLVKAFLNYASKHTINELQHFTNNHVPVPTWISKEDVVIPQSSIEQAAEILTAYLERDPGGIDKIGGKNWWKYRGKELTGEWIEMKKDKIKRGELEMDKVIFYVHGNFFL